MKVNGTLVNYYIHCKRQCYLHGNRINLEDESEDVKIGKAIHEEKKENENAIYNRSIKEPKDEPTIGVIDKPFNKSVYFSKWVESKNVGIPELAINEEDY